MKKIILLMFVAFGFQVMFSQTTTSSIKGFVKNSKKEVLAGANIVAVHVPTNSKYSDFADFDGSYSISNMKIGGPYTVTASFIGYQNQVIEEVYLELGKPFNLEIVLVDTSSNLSEVIVKSVGSKVFQGGRTGAETTIGRKELTTLPSISRSAEDFIRLEPSASGGSFGGRNDQYNNYSLNGAVFNNPFGLDAATPGGQTSAQPISLDAIDQIQVATAPYDVTLSGFTGASVNAVTKSGTNKITGTVYGFFRNESLTGDKIKGEKIFVPSLGQTQGGVSLGLPIIKDKLFVFGNFEFDNRTDLGANFAPNNADGITGINESRVLESDLIAVSTALKNLGYDTGAYQGFNYKSNSRKGIIKLDWNINDNHKLAFIYNRLEASKEKPANPTALGFRGPSLSILQFQNSSYQINNNLDSYLLELNSKFSKSVSNKLQVGYTYFDDFRKPFSAPAPVINIQDGAGSNYIIAGHEPFSINNKLEQKVFQVTNNLNYTIGKHEFTFGGSFEKFEFRNSFNLAAYDKFRAPTDPLPYYGTFGNGAYPSVAAFLADASNPLGSTVQNIAQAQAQNTSRNSFELGKKGGWNLAKLNVGQLAFYAQDDISVNENFKLTLGLRADKPLYFNTSENITSFIFNAGTTRNESKEYFNPQTNTLVKLISTQLPSDKLLWSPRLGFNWDTFGNKTLQLRGGTGIFTGKLPFVWIGNQITGADDGFLQLMDPDFKWPQVWRTSLGFDKKFESNYLLTVDLAYTNELNAVHVQNWRLKTPTGQLSGVDKRLIYQNSDKLYSPFESAYVMTNSDAGSSFNSTVKLQKTFNNGLFVSAAYNFLVAESVNSIEAEITGDAFNFNPALDNVNDAVISNSKYGDKHRFIAVLSKKFKYGSDDKWATTFTTFGEYAQGNRYSYIYGGDINSDGSDRNDLLYIPTAAEVGTMIFAGSATDSKAQAIAFNNFINQDQYLNSRRGQYAERYGALSPWTAKWDVKIMQDYNFKVSSNSDKKNTIQFSVDILNFGNLLNSNWGLVQVPTTVQPIGVNVVANTPVYSFTGTQTKTFNFDSSLASRWQAQFGLRYIF